MKGGGVEEVGSVSEGDDLSGCCTDWVWDLYDRQGAGRMGDVPVMAGTRRGSVCKRDTGGAWGMSVRGVMRSLVGAVTCQWGMGAAGMRWRRPGWAVCMVGARGRVDTCW